MPSAACSLRHSDPYGAHSSLGMWGSLGWVLGCMLQLWQPYLWPAPVYMALVLVALLMGVLGWMWRRKCHRSCRQYVGVAWLPMVIWVLAAATLGAGQTGWRAAVRQQQALDVAWQGRDVVVQGVVVSLPHATERGQRWLFDVEQAWLPLEPQQAVVLPRRLSLSSYDADFSVMAGQRWRWTVRLRVPHGVRNPYGFDAELWWWSQNVHATGYVRHSVGKRSKVTQAPQLLAQTWIAPVQQWRGHVRTRMQQLADSMDARQQASLGVVTALLTGDQASITHADWQLFRDTGVAHLVSISGLHITMFAWAAVACVGWLWRRSMGLCLWIAAPTAALWAGWVLAGTYAVFSGWGVPAQRTLGMLFLAVFLRVTGRIWPWPRVWLTVLAWMVAWDPWVLLQAGFWLSFVAVGVLFAAAPLSGNISSGTKLPRIWHALRHMVREQMVISLSLAPLTVLLFGQTSIVGVLANLWAIPWVTLVVTPLSMLGVVYPPLWTWAMACVDGMVASLHQMAQWPGAVAYFAQAPLWISVLGVLGGLWMVMTWSWPNPLRLRWLGLPLVLPMLLWTPARPPVGAFDMLALDVGQGSAVLLRTATHSLLFDAGPRWRDEGGDAGHMTIVPVLRALGVRLDMLMVSHPDLDHAGGALSVLAAQPQAQLVGSAISSVAAQAGVTGQSCVRGMQWYWDGVHFEVLHPWVAPAPDAVNIHTNAVSCVLRVVAADGTAALLTGDIERQQEQALVRSVQEGEQHTLRADVLLVPHHGSRTSSSAQWVAATQPQVAVFQAGWNNRFGHPVPEVVRRYTRMGSLLRNTATCGAVHWDSRTPAAAPCEREIRPRYWQHNPGADTIAGE